MYITKLKHTKKIFMNKIVKDFLDTVESNNKGESEFLQAVDEVAEAVRPILNQHSRFDNKKILITGGTGSFGSAFVRYLLENFPNLKRIVIFK